MTTGSSRFVAARGRLQQNWSIVTESANRGFQLKAEQSRPSASRPVWRRRLRCVSAALLVGPRQQLADLRPGRDTVAVWGTAIANGRLKVWQLASQGRAVEEAAP